MNKIRLIFLILLSVITIICLYLAGTFNQSPPGLKKEKISEFKITKISGNGKVYFDTRPIDADHLAAGSAKAVDVTRMNFSESVYFRTETQTSFEVYCFKTRFVVMPGSYFLYQPKTREICFYSGEIYWNREQKGKPVEMSLKEPKNLLTLSRHGRARVDGDAIRIWNYRGELKFHFNEADHSLRARQMLTTVKQPVTRSRRPQPPRPPVITTLLPAPGNPDPLDKTVVLTKPDASIVRLDWRVVRGNPSYKVRLYSSDLMENMLLERDTEDSDITLDMLQFEERELYWRVTPVARDTKLEGIPTQMGYIKVIGALLEKKNVSKPPELNINSITVNGEVVFIRGTAETNASLYINDEKITIDRDGSFIHDITYKTIGPKKIVIRLVSPLGVETRVEETKTIYAIN